MPAAVLHVAEGVALPETKQLPPTYESPISTLPTVPEAELCDGSIPIIDLEALHGPRRSHIVKQLSHACQHKGFFAVGFFFFLNGFIALKIRSSTVRSTSNCKKIISGVPRN
jgi:hypothetical protein